MVKKSTGNEGLTMRDLKKAGFAYVRKGDGVQELEFRERGGAVCVSFYIFYHVDTVSRY